MKVGVAWIDVFHGLALVVAECGAVVGASALAFEAYIVLVAGRGVVIPDVAYIPVGIVQCFLYLTGHGVAHDVIVAYVVFVDIGAKFAHAAWTTILLLPFFSIGKQIGKVHAEKFGVTTGTHLLVDHGTQLGRYVGPVQPKLLVYFTDIRSFEAGVLVVIRITPKAARVP